jgi:hypothetical protein
MRTVRLAVVLVSVVAALLAGSAAAQAAPKWPAKCKTFSCVNTHLNQLHAQVVQMQAKNKAHTKTLNNVTSFLNVCLLVAPIDITPDTGGSPLTLTNSGDTPSGGWFLIDGCQTGTATKPAVRHDTAFRQFHAQSGISRL